MPKLLIIAGANGVGKSTLFESYSEDKKILSQYINPDKEDKKEVVRKLYERLENNLDISRETTLTGKKIFQFIEKAKSKSYRIHLICLLVKDVNICIERLNHYQLKLVGCNYRLEVSDYSKEILERLFDWKESV
jgi:predicted ABC-type ATPase